MVSRPFFVTPFPNRAGELSPHSALQFLFAKWRRGLSCMNVLTAFATDHKCFAPSRRHLLPPLRLFLSPWFLQIRQFAHMMNFYVFFRTTKLTCVCKYSLQ
jgi:hypothetical protein